MPDYRAHWGRRFVDQDIPGDANKGADLSGTSSCRYEDAVARRHRSRGWSRFGVLALRRQIIVGRTIEGYSYWLTLGQRVTSNYALRNNCSN